MSNMSYCRFQNTLKDLSDCASWIDDNVDFVQACFDNKTVKIPTDEDGDPMLSREEYRSMKDLIFLCRDLAEHLEGDED